MNKKKKILFLLFILIYCIFFFHLRIAWYKGSVFYEIFPASFKDSNNDGLGDIRGIISRLDYLQDLGVGAIRLNSIFPSKQYPDQYEMITNLMEVDSSLGDENDISRLSYALHIRNISLILDLPLHPYLKQLNTTKTYNITSGIMESSDSERTKNIVTEALKFWLSKGVDGFYIKNLEYFSEDCSKLLENIAEWKITLGNNRILIVSYDFIEKVQRVDQNSALEVLNYVDLVDVCLNISNGTSNLSKQIESVLDGILKPNENGAWIQWSLGGVSKRRISNRLNTNATLAATLLQLMLPGTPSIFYGDEVSLEESYDPLNEHKETQHLHHLPAMIWNGTTQFTEKQILPWLPKAASVTLNNFYEVAKMINIRNEAPSIYKNSFSKDGQSIQNTNILHTKNEIIVIERYYPRRNSFASISNFGKEAISVDLTSMFYSGEVMLGQIQNSKIYFDNFNIKPMQSIIVKLDK